MSSERATDKPGGRQLAGVFPVFQTAYRDDESIDFETVEKEIDWLFERGANGIVLAMVSEVLRLSSEEREQLGEVACRAAKGRGAVVLSVGAESSHTAERYARHAERCGADGLMAIPPLAVALPEGEIRRYYERILAASELPLIVQDASNYVGRPLSLEFQKRLLEDHGPERILYKPETSPVGQRLSSLREATGGRARVFEGSGGIALVDNFRRGIVGTMPGAEIIDGIVRLWRALEAGDDEAAYRLSLPISSLVALEESFDAFTAVEKHLLVRQGIFRNTLVRGPVAYALDDETRREVDRLFERLEEALSA